MNWFIGEQWDATYTKKNSLPTGTEAPYSFRLAIKGGELSSSTGISGSSGMVPVSSLGVSIAADLAGSGDIEGNLNLTSSLSAALAGVGDMDGSLRGTANLEATILVNPGAATSQDIASAVWDAVAVDNDVPGTMGEKLNAAGTAGDPWTTDLSGYNVAGTAGKKLKDNLTQNNFLALK